MCEGVVCLQGLIVATADKLIELFNEAKAKRAGAEREAFLSEACGSDSHLKEQVFSLLRAEADEGDSDFLKRTPLIRSTALNVDRALDMTRSSRRPVRIAAQAEIPPSADPAGDSGLAALLLQAD